jgi:Flp pilus assembly protein TadG
MKEMRHSRRGGNTLIEFSLLGIPIIFMTISIVAMSINMWVFHNLAYATQATARYVTTHGYNCTVSNNSCAVTLGTVAQYFSTQALALDPAKVNVTFTDSSATSCSPLNTCTSSTSQFPATGANAIGSDIKITATYLLKNPIAMYWPPDRDQATDFTVGATSKQRIVF